MIFSCLLVSVDAVLALTLTHGYLLTTIGDLTQCLLLLVVLRTFLRNLEAKDQRARIFWALMSLGVGIWLCAQMLWTYFEVILGQDVPNPFCGDIVLVLHLVPLMSAMAVQPDREPNAQTAAPGALDFLQLLVWWLYLYLFVVIPWQYVSPNAVLYGRNFDLIYLLEHLAFVSCAGLGWIRAKGAWKTTYGYLVTTGGVYALGSEAAGYAIDRGWYYTGSLYDIPLLSAMVLFITTGMIFYRLNETTEVVKEPEPRRRGWVSGLAMLALMSLPVLAGWSFYFSTAPTAVRYFRLGLTLGAMLLMATLVWIKQRSLDRQLAATNQELQEDAFTDSLTGCRNRRFLTTTIDADVRHAIRSYFPIGRANNRRNRDLVFYLIDFDAFKEVNELHGHDVGDELLISATLRISAAIRHSDALIRWGGDEFLVVSRYTNRDDAQTLAARVLHAFVNEPFELKNGVKLSRTCSVGWAPFPWYVHDPGAIGYKDILKLADFALYEAKKLGRNRAVGMLPSLEEAAPGMTTVLGGKNDRLSESLAAYTLVTLGSEVQVKSTATSAVYVNNTVSGPIPQTPPA